MLWCHGTPGPATTQLFLRTPTKTHRKRIGNAICANFLPPTNWGNALGVSETLWAFPKHRGDRLGNEVSVWKRKLRFQGCRSNFFPQNVVGNVNHVSDTLFAFPKAFSRTFPETLRKRKLRFQSRPWRKRRNLRKRDLRFRDAKNVSETHRIFGNVICVSDENGNAKKTKRKRKY